MKQLNEKSIDCCVTSPPYYGLRDYGVDGQIGLEQTPDEYIEKLVDVFREVKRILKDDGTLWVNIADSYAGSGKGMGSKKGSQKESYVADINGPQARVPKIWKGIKPKDLIGIPWMLAFALRKDGWYLRSDVIWEKPNAMPSSVKDRCNNSHEYIFMLSKSKKYYFDHDAIKENAIGKKGTNTEAVKRNKRTVWRVNTKPYKEAHFATFPPELIEPCVLAGCPKGGTVIDPFGGSGTVAGVAMKLNRNSILCELNPAYTGLVSARVESIIKG